MILKSFNIKVRLAAFDHFATEDNKVSIEYGADFNISNIGVFFDYYDRGEINASEIPNGVIVIGLITTLI